MLEQETRAVILRLKKEGQGILPIARVLKVSPNTVRKVLAEGQSEVPDFARTSSVEAHQERIEALYTSCEGNLVRVQEELEAEQQEKFNALKAEQDARIAEIRAASDQETLNRLMDRLMALAGYAKKTAPKADGA